KYLHEHEVGEGGVGNFLDFVPESLVEWEDLGGVAPYGYSVLYAPSGATQGDPVIQSGRVRVNSNSVFSETFALYLIGDKDLWELTAPLDDNEWPASGFLPAGETATFTWKYNTNATDENVFFFGPMDAQVDAYTTAGSSWDFTDVVITTIPGTLPSSHTITMGPYGIDTFLYAFINLGFSFTGGDGWWAEVFDFDLDRK